MMARWESDGVSISQLAARTGLSKANMTPLLKKLEEKGLVSIKRTAQSDRQKQVTLEKKAKRWRLKVLLPQETHFVLWAIRKRR